MSSGNCPSGNCPVGELSGRGNVRSGNCPDTADHTDIDMAKAKAAIKREAGHGHRSRVYGESVAVLGETEKARILQETSSKQTIRN